MNQNILNLIQAAESLINKVNGDYMLQQHMPWEEMATLARALQRVKIDNLTSLYQELEDE